MFNISVTKQTFTVEEAAVQLGIGRNSAYEAARRGDIPTIKIGKRILVPRAALERFLEASPREPQAEEGPPWRS